MSSCFPIKKKQLLPSKKAWRGFASELRYKLEKIERSKPIKHLSNAIRGSRSRHRRRSAAYTKKVVHCNCNSFVPVYVDQLFQPKLEPTMVVGRVEQSPIEEVQMKTSAAVASSSTLAYCSVDVRAEMFIAKFKEDMRLQRQKSLEKYQEMLARSV